jgi:hypothetical protein
MSVRCFFCRSDLSQTTVVRAQHKSQRIFFEIFSKLVSAFSAFVHLDSESPKVPFFIGTLRVRCTIRTFRHNFPPSRVIGKITIEGCALFRFLRICCVFSIRPKSCCQTSYTPKDKRNRIVHTPILYIVSTAPSQHISPATQ